jgi:Tfp pilus assembly PilM family ATPase/Tfp pilus assembly protein PilN
MGKKIISIEAGIWWTKVCLVDYRKAVPRVYQAFVFETPEHAIEDGYIRDREKFSAVLMKEIQKHGIKERDVIFTLSSSKVVTREIVLPLVKESKIANIIDSQVDDYFPMDVSEYVISYTKMGQFEEDGQKKLKLALVAVPDNLLKNYYSFAEEARLRIESFDYIGNGAIQLMRNRLAQNSVVVQLEEQATVISIFVNKRMVFQRVTPYGYTTPLAGVMDHAVFGVEDEKEAFNFLLQNELMLEMPKQMKEVEVPLPEGKTKQDVLLEACEDVRESLSYYLRMVSTALEYYRTHQGGEIGGTLYLIGDGARLAGIQKVFDKEFPLTVHQEDYQSFVDFHKCGLENEFVSEIGFLSVVGAVIHPLDVKSKEQKALESRKSNHPVHLLLAASILLSVVLVLVSTLRKLNAVREQKELQQQIASLSAVESVYEENEKVRQAKEYYEQIDAATKTQNEQFEALLEALEQEFPKKVTVKNLNITDGVITMSVTSPRKLEAAQLLINLKEISLIQDISIPSIAKSDNDGTAEWQYTILASYKPQEELDALEAEEGK